MQFNPSLLNGMREEVADKKISFAIIYYFIALAANATIKNVLSIDESLYGMVSALFGVSIVFFIGRAFKYVYRRNGRLLTSCYIIAFMLLVYSLILCVLRGESYDLMIKASFFPFMIWFLPIGVYACSIKNKQIFYDYVLKGSYVVSILMFFFFIFREKENQYGAATYDMTFGLTLVTPAIIHLNEFLRNRRKLLLVIFLVEFTALLLYGNRAILLNVVFFVIYKFAFSSKNANVVIRNSFILAVFGIIIFGALQSVFSMIGDIMTTYGIQSRTLAMLTGESIFESTERLELWDISLNMIKENPILGYGFGGEYYHIAYKYGGSMEDVTGAFHPHNGVLQLIVDFGVIGGGLITFFCIRPFWGLRRKIKDDVTFDLILIFGSFLIPKLYSASGILISPEIAIFLFLYYTYKNKSVQCQRY